MLTLHSVKSIFAIDFMVKKDLLCVISTRILSPLWRGSGSESRWCSNKLVVMYLELRELEIESFDSKNSQVLLSDRCIQSV